MRRLTVGRTARFLVLCGAVLFHAGADLLVVLGIFTSFGSS